MASRAAFAKSSGVAVRALLMALFAALPVAVCLLRLPPGALAACSGYGYGCAQVACIGVEVNTNGGSISAWQNTSAYIYGWPGYERSICVRTVLGAISGQLEGWSFGLRHNVPATVSANDGYFTLNTVQTAIMGIQNGLQPDYKETHIRPCGYIQGVMIDQDATGHKLNAPATVVTSYACYRVKFPTQPGIYPVTLSLTDDVGTPAIQTIVTQGGQTKVPCKFNLTLNIYSSTSYSPTPTYCCNLTPGSPIECSPAGGAQGGEQGSQMLMGPSTPAAALSNTRNNTVEPRDQHTPLLPPLYRVITQRDPEADPLIAPIFQRRLNVGTDLQIAALEFLGQNPEIEWRLDCSQRDLVLKLASQQGADGHIVINLERRHGAMRIEAGRVQLVFTSTGALLLFGFLDVRDWGFNTTRPSIDSFSARSIAAAATGESTNHLDDPQLVYIASGYANTFMLSWRVRVHTEELFIDALYGSIARRDRLWLGLNGSGNVSGFATPLGSVLPDFSSNPVSNQNLPGVPVLIQPDALLPITNDTGHFTFETNNQQVTATLVLQSDFLTIEDAQKPSDQEDGLDGISLVLNDIEDHPERERFTAQLNAWLWLHKGRQFLDDLYPRNNLGFFSEFVDCIPAEPPQIVNGVPTRERNRLRVLVKDLGCGNAGHMIGECPPLLRFHDSSATTHNTAYSSIIAHEFGHCFVLEVTRVSSHEGLMHEAFAEIFATYLMNSPKIAVGLKKGFESVCPPSHPNEGCFQRNSETGEFMVSDVCSSDPIEYKQDLTFPAAGFGVSGTVVVFAGAWWDLRARLAAADPANGSATAENLLIRWMASHTNMELHSLQVGPVLGNEVLVIDDHMDFGGNQNLSDGTPHAEHIIAAFAGRNLMLRNFRRGDANGDSTVNITDAIVILDYLFRSGVEPPCVDAADADDVPRVNITDPVFLLNFLFRGSMQPPPAPGPDMCGPDGTSVDNVTCLTGCN